MSDFDIEADLRRPDTCPLCLRPAHPGGYCFDVPAPLEEARPTPADLREEIADAIVDTWRVAMTDESTVLATARRFADAAMSVLTERGVL